ncbi:TetR/AcrR family transcriptional regulator [Amycolatopsis keratiniphila]|uniref:TetR family transcriptional regulator n=1 Tax=Amycolatopsis keratiniphila subsp. keratiniphila TaxID=227715 RepID=A0A1W2LJ24_9PSEU|nr:TetR family transcriptional regulator [Amycolatopsis keratiniphila]OLZ52984.1 TetR family transcriptional regulator [Amycolatopsis keratiniphila subsp. nogabecina]ONF62730.1 TetR family transcriptional regulator [Amycolatopsis keratiniphila subsp. keratiniphila]SDU05944.1 DNA-binding transcriptional regulator, AcrR family [Amycolatopsis keratiniphila]
MTEHEKNRRPGRWRSGAESKRRILQVARELFHEHGYGSTTVRMIATAAEVDPAMVFYFFGTKQGLFSAAIEISGDVPPAVEALFDGGLDGIGERLVRTLVGNLDKSDRTPLMMLTRSAPADPRSEALLREFIDREITGRLAALLGTPDAALRAGMVNVQILGLAVARYIMRIEPIASSSVDELAATFGPLVQHCLTGPATRA